MSIVQTMIRFIQKRFGLVFLLPWIVYFAYQWSSMVYFSSNGSLYARNPWIWADWALHIALANIFVYKPPSLWFTSYPHYAGATLTYPFATNLLTGLLMRFGFRLPAAFLFPSLILSLLVIVLLYKMYLHFFRSEKLSVFATTAFLCSGGLGVIYAFVEKGYRAVFFDSQLILSAYPSAGIEVNNVTTSMIFPQRAFLLGFPIGLWILLVIVSQFESKREDTQKKRMVRIFAGILAGFLPIIHTHTSIVIVLFSCWYFCLTFRHFSKWLWYAVPALVTGTIVYTLFFFGHITTGSFLSFHPGWYIQTGLIDWIVFWIKNWGVFFFASLLGTALLLYKKEYVLLRTVLFFWGLFFLANLLQFQPQLWDNTKIFAWVYMGLCIASAYAYREIYRKFFSSLGLKVFLALCAVLMVASGGIDIVHNLDWSKKTYQMLSADAIELAVYVREHTAIDSVILTADTVQNPIAMFSARSVLLGYAGWMFNFGLPYAQRQIDIPLMYKDPSGTSFLYEKYKIGYIVISRDEEQYELGDFSTGFEKVFTNSYGTVYKRL